MKISNADYLSAPAAKISATPVAIATQERGTRCSKHNPFEDFISCSKARSHARRRRNVTVPKYGGVLVGPEQLRQVFNDNR